MARILQTSVSSWPVQSTNFAGMLKRNVSPSLLDADTTKVLPKIIELSFAKKSVPLIVTSVPDFPDVGLKLVIIGKFVGTGIGVRVGRILGVGLAWEELAICATNTGISARSATTLCAKSILETASVTTRIGNRAQAR